MVDGVGSSSLGAAVALRQATNQQNFNISALNQTADLQQQAVSTLLGGADASGNGGGNVTATRGQNLNIVV